MRGIQTKELTNIADLVVLCMDYNGQGWKRSDHGELVAKN